MSLFFFFFFEGALSNEREEVKKARESVFFTFSRLVCDDTASEKNKQTCRSFSITPSLSFPLFDPASDTKESARAVSEVCRAKKRKPAFSESKMQFHRSGNLCMLVEQGLNVKDDDGSPKPMKLAVVGRPNVGKSTLINTWLGEERLVAFDLPGTTRDAISIPFERNGQQFELIDTAGLRRRGKVFEAIEKFSVVKTLQAIESANVALLLLDATQGVTDQDAHIAGYILETGRAVVLAVNKWDAVDAYQRELLARWPGAVRPDADLDIGIDHALDRNKYLHCLSPKFPHDSVHFLWFDFADSSPDNRPCPTARSGSRAYF